MTPDEDTAASLAAKLYAWGRDDLTERERQVLLALVWRHADALDRVRVSEVGVLDEAEEALVSDLEAKFGWGQ